MRRALVLLPLALGACTGKVGDPQLWARACARSQASADESTPEALEECKASMASHPPAVADDMARCALEAPAGLSPEAELAAFQACISPTTRDYLDRREAAQEQLDELAGQLARRRQEGEGYPAGLAELTGAPVLDPWNNPLAYEPKDDGFELCSLGPDARRGTPDDICYTPPFIYFQF